ncbi:MAG: iron-sulfur cluster assembly protein, partial [Actinomycetota bacterium]
MSQASAITEEDVRMALSSVNEPELRRPLTELDLVRGVVVAPGGVHVSVALTVEDHPLKAKIHDQVV